MSKKYYKIVSDKHMSVCDTFADDYKEFSVRYEVGSFVKPKKVKTKLFCFSSLKNVEEFTKCIHRKYLVYECEIKNPGYPRIISNPCGLDYFREFWVTKNKKKLLNCYTTKIIPKGTVSCDEIKLTRLVAKIENHRMVEIE